MERLTPVHSIIKAAGPVAGRVPVEGREEGRGSQSAYQMARNNRVSSEGW